MLPFSELANLDMSYEAFIKSMYRNSEFKYLTDGQEIISAVTDTLKIVGLLGFVALTGGTALGVAIPAWGGTTVTIAGSTLTAMDVWRLLTGKDVDGRPLTDKEKNQIIKNLGTEVAVTLLTWGILRYNNLNSSIKSYDELLSQTGLTQAQLDDVLSYTGKTPSELLDAIQGTNIMEYLNGTTIYDLLKKYNLNNISEVWKLSPTERGQVLEELLAHSEYTDWYHCGVDMGGYFPYYDFELNGSVISLKTIDPSLPSYIDGGVNLAIENYINDLSLPTFTNPNGNIVKRILDIRIPQGTKDLLDLDYLIQYAKENGITLKIKEY
ncbi:MAG: hypothetical protein ACK5LC_10995, partial [Coprobacillaceae bacterium]